MVIQQKEKMKKHYNVVAAVVCIDGKYLCMQKGKTKFDYTSYKWEFPGGKIEPGETPQEALKRELMEEMDYPVEVGEEIAAVTHEYPDFSITLTAFLCKPLAKCFRLTEHVAFEWHGKDELAAVDWAAADVDIINGWLMASDSYVG